MYQLHWVWQALRDNFGFRALLDILVVAVAIYCLLRLVRGTRAVQLIKGILVLLGVVLLTQAASLETTSWLLGLVLLPGVIALVILFQPELRMALEQIGRGRLWSPSFSWQRREELTQVAAELVRATSALSQQRTGALLVLERQVGLNDIVQTGRHIGGQVSADLLTTIFHPGTPLHDLAVVIRGNEVVAAGCLLPLTDRQDVAGLLGTRHRAALGLSETTDALVIVISEETGVISLAQEGRLFSNVAPEVLKQRLLEVFFPPERRSSQRQRRKRDAAS